MRSWEWGPYDNVSAFMRRNRRYLTPPPSLSLPLPPLLPPHLPPSFFSLCLPFEDTARTGSQEEGSHQELNWLAHGSREFIASTTAGNKCPLFKPPVYGILLRQPELNKTNSIHSFACKCSCIKSNEIKLFFLLYRYHLVKITNGFCTFFESVFIFFLLLTHKKQPCEIYRIWIITPILQTKKQSTARSSEVTPVITGSFWSNSVFDNSRLLSANTISCTWFYATHFVNNIRKVFSRILA